MFKYKMSILFLLIVCLCWIGFVNANGQNLVLLGKVIYIDPGHGGIDPGAIYKTLEEKDLNLNISKRLQIKLESLGAIVYLTRYGDYDLAVPNAINRKRSDLSRRANIINKSLCDMYLSIHLNAEISSTWSGAQVFYDNINDDNKTIANIMQSHLKTDLKTNREFKETST